MVAAALAACGGEAVVDPGSGSGGGTSTSGSTSSSTSSTTTGTDLCGELALQHSLALEQARICNPVISSEQCTLLVDDQLACPCPTYVNPANTGALAELDSLHAQWAAGSCQIPCPLIECPDLQGAGCDPGGSCQDYLPD